MTQKLIKCHKCRHVLLEYSCLLLSSTCNPQKCESYNLNKFLYISEDKVPTWIKNKIEDEEWTKGRLHCEKCHNRIGSFDYVSGRKCECGETVLPSIHFVSSQVDRPLILNL